MAQHRANILVVDDELGTRESLRVILEGRHQVKTVDRGREALRLIASQEPDMVFLDLLMPEMNGIEVLRQIKQMSSEIPVAIVTAYASLENAQEALRLGAADYLTKPFDKGDVERVVEKGLSLRRQHQQARRSMEAAQKKILSIEREKKQLQEQLIQTERLRALGEMAAGIAHDFNNLLTLILTRVQLLGSKLDPLDAEALQKGLGIIQRAALDGAETVRRIWKFTRAHEKKEALGAVDLCRLIQEVVELTRSRWETEAQGQGIQVELGLELAEVPPVAGHEAELREVLTNLIFNALEAMPQGGRLSISTGRSGTPAGVEVRVRDTGLGMPAEVKGKIFDPFFTTKGPGNSGLGLSVSYGIVARHGGTIEVESQEGLGSTLVVRLRTLET